MIYLKSLTYLGFHFDAGTDNEPPRGDMPVIGFSYLLKFRVQLLLENLGVETPSRVKQDAVSSVSSAFAVAKMSASLTGNMLRGGV